MAAWQRNMAVDDQLHGSAKEHWVMLVEGTFLVSNRLCQAQWSFRVSDRVTRGRNQITCRDLVEPVLGSKIFELHGSRLQILEDDPKQDLIPIGSSPAVHDLSRRLLT